MALFLAILFVYQLISPGLYSEPAQAKQVVTALPGTFSSSWNNPANLLNAPELTEKDDIHAFTTANSAYPLFEIKKEKKIEAVDTEKTDISSSSPTNTPATAQTSTTSAESGTSTISATSTAPSSTTEKNTTPLSHLLPSSLLEFFAFITEPFSIARAIEQAPTTTPLTTSTQTVFPESQEKKAVGKKEKEKETEVATTTTKSPQLENIPITTTTKSITATSTAKSTNTTLAATTTKNLLEESTTSTLAVTSTPQAEPTEDSGERSKKEQSYVELGMFTVKNRWNIHNPHEFKLKNPRLVLSFANDAVPNHEIALYYKKKDVWRTLVTFKLDEARSNKVNNGYFYLPLNGIHDLTTLETFEMRIAHIGPDKLPLESKVFIDGVWIEAERKEVPTVPVNEKKPISVSSTRKHFSLEENVSFVFQYTDTSTKAAQVIEKIVSFLSSNKFDTAGESNRYDVQAAIYDTTGREISEIEPEISYFENNVFSVSIDKKMKKIVPGKYILDIDVYTPQGIQEHQEEFNWGLLAVNTNKATYSPHETAYIQMAALEENGHTICDANLQLTVIAPSGQEETPEILLSGICGPNNVVDKPDYFSYYTVKENGTHTLVLNNLDTGGEIFDSFDVSDSAPFDIERTGPTRIYPAADYSMNISITASQNFLGTIQERAPHDFIIKQAVLHKKDNPSQTFPLSIINDGGDTRIEGDVHWQAGETYEVSYLFDAPNVSPFLFLIGPLNLTASTTPYNSSTTTAEESQKAFKGHYAESRQWQIASDAIGTIDPDGDGTVACSPTPAGTHAQNIDDLVRSPATPDTGDYISCTENSADFFTMTSLTGVSTSTGVIVYAHYKNNNAEMQWDVELWNAAETQQYGTTQTLTNTTTVSWSSVIFTGLSLTQTQLDGLRIKFINKKTGGGTADSSILYAMYAEVDYTPSNSYPNVSGVSVNGGNTIILSENTTTIVTVTSTVSDSSGYTDIESVVAKLYRAGVTNAESCSENLNNCYQTTCSLTNCSGNSCVAICDFTVEFFAEPTDSGTPWQNDYWRAYVLATDWSVQSAGAYSVTGGPDLASLVALDFTTSTNYGTLIPGQKIDPLAVTTTITSTGNTSIDLMIYGSDMTNGMFSIPVTQQRYALASSTSFASSTQLLANPGERVQINLPKNLSSRDKQSKTMWWGIEIPIPTAPGSFSGTITSIGVVNELSWP